MNKDKWKIAQLENELRSKDTSLSKREREEAKVKSETAKSRYDDIDSGWYSDDFYGTPK
tara:strand:- start:135379 stop:135555 length:177 start_codon:yes stop_codon:yes gene_type:complete